MKPLLILFIFFLSYVPSLNCQTLERESLILTLQESIDLALQKNAEILVQNEKLNETKALIGEAKSELLPQLNLDVYHYRYRDHPYITFTENYEASLSLNQTLYAGGALINALRSAKLKLRVEEEKLSRTHQELMFKVKEAFYKVLLAEQFVDINRETLSLAGEHLEVAKKRYESGEVSSYDVLRAEVEVARIKPELIKAENYLKVTENEFKFILGLDLDSSVELEGELSYVPLEFSLRVVTERAFEIRPELRQLEIEKEIGEAGVSIAGAYRKPTLSLSLSNYWTKDVAFSEFYEEWNEWDDYFAGLIVVEVPIFDGLLARSKTQAALAQLEAVRILIKNLKEKVKLEVKNACLTLQSSSEVVASQLKNVDRAKEALGIIRSRYVEGKVSQLDLIDAEVALSRAKVDYAQSIYAQVIAKAALELATGE